jgi:hypothetical protein
LKAKGEDLAETEPEFNREPPYQVCSDPSRFRLFPFRRVLQKGINCFDSIIVQIWSDVVMNTPFLNILPFPLRGRECSVNDGRTRQLISSTVAERLDEPTDHSLCGPDTPIEGVNLLSA